MNSELLATVSSLAWKVIKEGTVLTYNFLSKKLKEKNTKISDDDIKKIVEIINGTPECYKLNELLVQGYLMSNEELKSIIDRYKNIDQNIIVQYSYGSGDNIGHDKIIKGKE